MFQKFKTKLAAGLVAVALALGIGLASKKIEGYNPGTTENPSIHQLLVDELEDFYSPGEADFNTNQVKLGSVREDCPEGAPDYLRSFHHFTNWQTKEGLWGVMPSSIKWALSPGLQSATTFDFDVLPAPIAEYFKKKLNQTSVDVDVLLGGNHSWSRAVEEYNDGEIGRNFGQIYHLISDLTVPAHTRDDAHWGDLKFLEKLTEGTYFQVALWPSDAYEVWTDEHRNEIMGQVYPTQVPEFNNLEDLMMDLAYFTGSNFYSDKGIDNTVSCSWEGNYCYREVEGQEVKILRKSFFKKFLEKYGYSEEEDLRGNFTDTECLKDMWSVLGTKAVEYGAGAMVLLEGGQQNCTPKNYKDCFNEDLRWFDSCGEPGEVAEYCDNGCSNGKCQSGPTCTDYDYKDCDGNEIWWFDSCGNSQEYVETCDNGCSDGECNGQSCSNECNYSGQKECFGNGWKECGDYDADDCLEWGKLIECGAGEYCENGTCKSEPQEKFVDLGNGTILDNDTGKVWQKSAASADSGLVAAIDYCKNLTLGGSSNWRIPKCYSELSQLCSPVQNGCTIDPIFEGPCGGSYSGGDIGKYTMPFYLCSNSPEDDTDWDVMGVMFAEDKCGSFGIICGPCPEYVRCIKDN